MLPSASRLASQLDVNVPAVVSRNRPIANTMSPYELTMRLIAQVAWLMRLSLPPQLGGPEPVEACIDPDVSRISTTNGLSGSPADAGCASMVTSAAIPSHGIFLLIAAHYRHMKSRKSGVAAGP